MHTCYANNNNYYWIFNEKVVNFHLQFLLDVWVESQEVTCIAEGIGSGTVASQHEADGVSSNLVIG